MLIKYNLPKISFVVFCSHTKSWHYFISSINNENFVATECDSWNAFIQGKCDKTEMALMGDNYSYKEDATGQFFLKTNSEFPYAHD